MNQNRNSARRAIRRTAPTLAPAPRPGATADALEPRRLLAATGAAISFAAATSFTTGSAPVAIVSADFNNDGNADLAVADRITDKVNIFFGNGAGAFTAGPTLTLTAPPSSMVAGDFDGNGSVDLAVATSPGSGSAAVSVFLNTAGTFAPAQVTTLYAGGSSNDPVALVAGNFNGDNHLDLAATDYSQGSVLVLDGTGAGTFNAAATYVIDSQPTSIVAADFNNDGFTDLAIAATQPATGTSATTQVISLLEGQTGGTFIAGGTIALTSSSANVLATADLNNDGLTDLIAGGADGVGETLLNETSAGGSFAFTAAAVGALPGPASAVAAADFNFDGDPDVIFSDGNLGNIVAGSGTIITSQSEVSVIEGNGDGTFATTTTSDFPTAAPPVALALGDFNNDGKIDVAVADESTGQVSILLNNTAGTVARPTTTTLATSAAAAPAATAVTLTATVATAGVGFDAGVPTGTVHFYDGTALLGSATLAAATTGNSTTAALTTTALPAGTDTVTARFVANSAFTASTSTAITETIAPTATSGPDLVGTLVSTTLPAEFAPGETATVRVRVTNQGNSIARGSITNVMSLVATDGTTTPITVRGNLAATTLNLQPGKSELLTGQITLPNALGPYTLSVDLNTTGSLAEFNTANNTVVLAASETGVTEFGDVDGRRSIALTESEGNATPLLLRLAGPGTGTVTLDSADIPSISLTGTTAATTLSVIAMVGGRVSTLPVSIANLSADAIIGAIAAPTLSLTGNLSLTGGARSIRLANLTNTAITLGAGPAVAMSLGAVSDSTLASAAGLASLSVASWTNAAGAVAAPWIGSLASRGVFDVNLALSGAGAPRGVALRAASLSAGIAGGIWSIGGNVSRLALGAAVGQSFSGSIAGTLTTLTDASDFDGDLAAANFGSILIRGSLLSADLLAGTNFGADGVAGGGDDSFAPGVLRSLVVDGSVNNSLIAAGFDSPSDSATATTGNVLLAGGVIKAVNLKGAIDSTSKILAVALPAKVHIAGAVTTPAADPNNFSL
jgi:hypothetical protein